MLYSLSFGQLLSHTFPIHLNHHFLCFSTNQLVAWGLEARGWVSVKVANDRGGPTGTAFGTLLLTHWRLLWPTVWVSFMPSKLERKTLGCICWKGWEREWLFAAIFQIKSLHPFHMPTKSHGKVPRSLLEPSKLILMELLIIVSHFKIKNPRQIPNHWHWNNGYTH
jgi:hypothetical protein